MANIKFKVGETVKVVQRTGSGMVKVQEDMIGTVHKIERITGRGYFLNDSGYSLWTDEMLELVVPHLNKNETAKERFFMAFKEMSVNGEFMTDGKETARITGYSLATINTLCSKVRRELENEGKIKFERRIGKHAKYSIVSENPKDTPQPKEENKLASAVKELEELINRAKQVEEMEKEIIALKEKLKEMEVSKDYWHEHCTTNFKNLNTLKKQIKELIA